jgi:hypothetical protein
MSPAGAQTIEYNTTTSFTLIPDANYQIASASGCGGTLAGDTYTTGPITEECTVTATFAIDTFTVTPSAGANGSIAPATPQAIDFGRTAAFTVMPDANYHIDMVTGCGGTLVGDIYTTAPISGPCNVESSFVMDTHALNVGINGRGSGKVTSDLSGIHCPGDCTEEYDYGTTITLTAAPEGKSVFGGWTGDCEGKEMSCEVNLDQARNVDATFISPFPWTMFLQAISGKTVP